MNLNVSSLFFVLALFFIPGFVWMKIHTRYGFKGEKSQFDLILNAFIFGVLSYAIVYVIYRCKGWSLEIFELDTQSDTLLDQRIFPEIIAATAVSIVGGILTLYVETTRYSPASFSGLARQRPMVTRTSGTSC